MGTVLIEFSGTFNDSAVAAAWDPATPDDFKFYAVYAASKTQGEKAAWEWIKKNKPNFVFNTVLPSFNVRPLLCVRKCLEGKRNHLTRAF